MFPPDADVSPYNPIATQSAADAKGPPRIIKHGNTRLPEQEDKPDRSVSAPPSPTRSRIDAAIAGTPCKTLNAVSCAGVFADDDTCMQTARSHR